MSLRNVAGLYLVRLRGRVGQELLALIGIAVGVALLFAALVANASLTGSFERMTHGVVGGATYQLAARGSSTINERLLVETQALPGVQTAAAVLQMRGEAAGPGGERSIELTGITPEFAAMGGAFTRGFSYRFLADVRAIAMPNPLVESLDLTLGESVVLNLNGRPSPARLGAKLQRSDVGDIVNSPVAVAPLRYAQELARLPGRVSRVFVVPRPGQDAVVERELTRLAGDRVDVRPADFDAALFRQASVPTSQSTTMFSLFGAMVGFLFAVSAMLLTAPQRRHLIADLQTEGYRSRTIVKVLMFDALVLGVAASVLGIVLGDRAAHVLFDETPSFLQLAFAVGAGQVVTFSSIALAAVGGVVASCVAVLGPTLSALRESEHETERTPRRRRLPIAVDPLVVTGLALLVGGIAIVAVAPTSAVLGIAGLGCLTVSMLVLLPSLLRLVVAVFDRVTDNVQSVVPFLVSFDLRDRTTRARSLAVAATGAIAVFASVSLQGAYADLLRGLDQTSRDVAAVGNIWALAPGDANLLVTTPIDVSTPRLPAGIEDVAAYRGGFLDIGDRRVRVFGPPSGGPLPLSDVQILDGDMDLIADRLRTGGWAVLSEAVARDLRVGVGDRFTLPSPSPVRLRVAGLSTNLGWPPGAVVLNGDDYARAWGSDRPSALLATLAPGTTPAQGRQALIAALDTDATLAVETADERIAAQDEASREGVARLAQIALLVLASAVVAMASAMAGLIWQRRGFLAGVKVEGYNTVVMWKALLLEAAILIGAGCGIGAGFGLLGQGLLSRALTSVTGFPVIYSPALANAVVTALAVTALAVVIVGVFGQRAASVAPESGLNG